MRVELLAARPVAGGVSIRFKAAQRNDFEGMRLRLKALPSREAAWMPQAFEGKGGFWLSGACWKRIGPTFANYAVYQRILGDGGEEDLSPKPPISVPIPARVQAAFQALHLLPSAPLAVVEAAWRALCKQAHPDTGGDLALMKRINDAHDIAEEWAKRHQAA